jgi:hypothetical protein
MNDNFIKQVIEYLYPVQNRVIAAVAFVRTFGQTLAGVFTVGASGLVIISVDNLQAIDWSTVGWTAAALFLSALLSGLKAFGDVSKNGLNSKYLESVVDPAELQAAVAAPVSAPSKTKTYRKVAAPAKAVKEEVSEKLDEPLGVEQAPAVEDVV